MENYLNANVDMLMFIERHQQLVRVYEPDEGITSNPVSDDENSQSELSSDPGDSDLASLDADDLEPGGMIFVPEGALGHMHNNSGSDSGEMTGSETELDMEDEHWLEMEEEGHCDEEQRDNEINDQQEELEAETR